MIQDVNCEYINTCMSYVSEHFLDSSYLHAQIPATPTSFNDTASSSCHPTHQVFTVKRALSVFGYDDAPLGHCEVIFKNVRVPASNVVLGEGRGFKVMQGRIGPGRLHHTMRAIGCAERGLEYMIARVHQRTAQGVLLADQGVIKDWITKSRIDIDAGRLLVCNAADMLDRGEAKEAIVELAICKIMVPNMACAVLDRAMQAHGAGGLRQDFPLAKIWAYLRTTRIADGPDEAHAAQLARIESKRYTEL